LKKATIKLVMAGSGLYYALLFMAISLSFEACDKGGIDGRDED